MAQSTRDAVRFHISLNVADLERSVRFFQALWGAAPAKHRSDYAKFEVDDPPLVLSLEPHAPGGRGALNHAGLRFPNSGALVAAQQRLEHEGIVTQREEGVECCYARQTKFWVNDPDGGLWEFYVLEGDLDHRGAGQAAATLRAQPAPEPELRSWEHRLGAPLEIPPEFASASLDELRLRGSFNLPVAAPEMQQFLQSAWAALRPGGELQLHLLTGDEALAGELQLPGPAAIVKHVPVREELLNLVAGAGFVDLRLTTFRPKACFEHGGVALRETRLACRRPLTDCGAQCTVVFKGPFATATDDAGRTWRRGQRQRVPLAAWEALEQSPLAELFVRLPETTVVGACGG